MGGAQAPSLGETSSVSSGRPRTQELEPTPSVAPAGVNAPSVMASASTTVTGPQSALTGKMLGRYRVISRLAVGGMAELWLALKPGRDGEMQKVVLKTMLPNVADSREFVRMFESEAAIGGKLRHPNLVRILDYGRVADRYFIAMEYIDGLTLRQIGQRFAELEQPFPQRLLLTVVMDVCRGLHAAHELSDRNGTLEFVHRDVSPENIMVTRAGGTKLIDFGAALTLRIPPTTARFVGKFRYVAPERIEGRPEDRRGDVYSLGVILYEYLTGSRPFEGDDLAMVSRILEGRPRPPQDLSPDLMPELVRITCKALALKADDRYPTAAALATDLLPLLEGPELLPGKDESQRCLRRAFDMPGGLGGETETSATSEADTKTVEMEVGALKEALQRTREETTVVRRMSAQRRRPTDGRGVAAVGRSAAATRATGIRPRQLGPGGLGANTPTPLPVQQSVATAEPVVTAAASPEMANLKAAPPSPPPVLESPVPVPVSPIPSTMSAPPPSLASVARPLISSSFRPLPQTTLAPATPAEPVVAPAPAIPDSAPPPAAPPPVVAAPAPSRSAPVPVAAVAPAPQRPAGVAPTWLFERRTRPAPPPAANGFFPDRAPPQPVGWFDIRRGDDRTGGDAGIGLGAMGGTPIARPPESSAPAFVGRRAPPARDLGTTDERRRPPVDEAVRLFDHGLALLSDKLYAAALDEWERACALEPENRMYQVNLKRLRDRLQSNHSEAGPNTQERT